MRKLMLSASLAGLLLTGVSVWASSNSPPSQSGQQSQIPTKAVAGKVTSIGTGGTSFALEVNEGNAKRTMRFVLDKNAQVQGNLKVGTAVTVVYAEKQGQNLALSIAAPG